VTLEIIGLYLGAGAFAGLLAGLLGVGGGLILVPALLYSFRVAGYDEGLVLHLALGTSLTAIVFNALSSIRAHQRRGAIRWELVRQLTPGLLIGTLVGSFLAAQMETPMLALVFGVFALLMGIKLMTGAQASGHFDLPGPWGQSLAGGIIGVISALVGIGGGSLNVPYQTACRVPMRHAVATAAACGLPIAISGSLGYLWTGWQQPNLPPYSSGFIHWPALLVIALAGMLLAPLGAWLAHKLPVAHLKRIMGLLLLILGTRMMLGNL
jgi:uncharacterized membrane protein YfcA